MHVLQNVLNCNRLIACFESHITLESKRMYVSTLTTDIGSQNCIMLDKDPSSCDVVIYIVQHIPTFFVKRIVLSISCHVSITIAECIKIRHRSLYYNLTLRLNEFQIRHESHVVHLDRTTFKGEAPAHRARKYTPLQYEIWHRQSILYYAGGISIILGSCRLRSPP